MTTTTRFSLLARWTAGALCVASLAACAPLVVGGAVTGGAIVATDRRSSGAQLDDQGIELRAANRLRDQLGNQARVSVTSYNRRVLLTGEAASESDKARAEAAHSPRPQQLFRHRSCFARREGGQGQHEHGIQGGDSGYDHSAGRTRRAARECRT